MHEHWHREETHHWTAQEIGLFIIILFNRRPTFNDYSRFLLFFTILQHLLFCGFFSFSFWIPFFFSIKPKEIFFFTLSLFISRGNIYSNLPCYNNFCLTYQLLHNLAMDLFQGWNSWGSIKRNGYQPIIWVKWNNRLGSI